METLPLHLGAEVEVGFLYVCIMFTHDLKNIYIYMYYYTCVEEMPPAAEPEQRLPGDHRQAVQE